MLTVKDLHKSYQVGKTTYEVLKGVSLTVEKGEFVAVMGPSGSGKTTLLNCISCYIPIDSGEIMLGDRQLANLSEDALAKVRNRQLGFVFQDFLLLDGLTVRENILLPAIIGGAVPGHVGGGAEMPVTMLRYNIVDGVGPVLQIAEGWTANLPDEVHDTIDVRTDRTWPTTWFAPRLTGEGAFKDVYSVMANWGANHGVTVYGHVGADLITLASMLRIPVTMHNVPQEKVYRPHAWASFGTQDTQAADYAACKFYGPLYK